MARKHPDADPARQQPGFEELLAEAESLAERMEEGGLSLDDSIRAYEKGVGNLRRCAELLRAAEDKVKTLVEKDGAFSLRDFEAPDDPDDEAAEEDEA